MFLLGFYCPVERFTPVPCPKGTYGLSSDAVSIDSCLMCPPHHYCPQPGLSAFLPCGPEAEQPLSGQDTCICPREGQSFQVTKCFHVLVGLTSECAITLVCVCGHAILFFISTPSPPIILLGDFTFSVFILHFINPKKKLEAKIYVTLKCLDTVYILQKSLVSPLSLRNVRLNNLLLQAERALDQVPSQQDLVSKSAASCTGVELSTQQIRINRKRCSFLSYLSFVVLNVITNAEWVNKWMKEMEGRKKEMKESIEEWWNKVEGMSESMKESMRVWKIWSN